MSLEPTAYIIDTVDLTIVPGRTVESGTPVTLHCQVIVSHDNTIHLTNTFQFMQDDILVHTYTTTEDTVLYELNPARAADSGNYECWVTVKDKSKSSNGEKLTVTGRGERDSLVLTNVAFATTNNIKKCKQSSDFRTYVTLCLLCIIYLVPVVAFT